MKKILYTAIAMLATVGCSDQGDAVDAAYDGEVRVSSTIATRNVGNQWVSGDAIGLYMSSGATYLGENAKYVTTGSGDFLSDSPLYYPIGSEVDFMAYYPYADGVDVEAYPLNVAVQSSLGDVDLMKAVAKNISYSEEPLSLTFEHLLSRVEFSFKTGEGVEWADLAGAEVTLVGSVVDGTCDLTNGEITLGVFTFDILMSGNKSGSKAEAIILPQPLSGAKLIVKLSDGRYFEADLADQMFESGCEYKYRATLSGDLQISSATIESWGEGNGAGEDLNAVPDIELVGNVYQIGSGKGLREFARLVNVGPTNINGKLMNNVDLEDEEFTPIGVSGFDYSGTFDGGGHLVEGLSVNSSSNMGLFGTVSGTIMNLGVSGSVICDGMFVGAIVGCINGGFVINCYSTATVEGEDSIGGIVGWNNGTVSNCYNIGTSEGVVSIGGIVGRDNGTVSNCYYVPYNNYDSNTAGTGMDSAEMKVQSFVDTLNANAKSYNDGLMDDYAVRACGWSAVTDGYPVFDPTSYPVTAN